MRAPLLATLGCGLAGLTATSALPAADVEPHRIQPHGMRNG